MQIHLNLLIFVAAWLEKNKRCFLSGEQLQEDFCWVQMNHSGDEEG